MVRLLRYHLRVFLQHSEDDPDPSQWAPAPLAMITDKRGQVAECARTFLDPSTGSLAAIKIPKRILGQLHGHTIRFWTGKRRPDLILGEGLKSAPSIGKALPEFVLAFCLTASYLRPLPRPVEVELGRRRTGDQHRHPHGQPAGRRSQ